jgi:hypothetical protein
MCVKTNKYTNYLFSLLIMYCSFYGSSYMFRHYIAILRELSYCLLTDSQLKQRTNINPLPTNIYICEAPSKAKILIYIYMDEIF